MVTFLPAEALEPHRHRLGDDPSRDGEEVLYRALRALGDLVRRHEKSSPIMNATNDPVLDAWERSGHDIKAAAALLGRTVGNLRSALERRGAPGIEPSPASGRVRKGPLLAAWEETGGDLDAVVARLGCPRVRVLLGLNRLGIRGRHDRPVPPCDVCGTEGGKVTRPGGRPERIALDALGLPGVACHHCYHRLKNRHRRGAPLAPETTRLEHAGLRRLRDAWERSGHDIKAAAALLGRAPWSVRQSLRKIGVRLDPPPPPPLLPCASCGDEGGLAGTSGSRPMRLDGARFGIDGKICCTCGQRLRARRRKGLPLHEPGRPGVAPKPVTPCALCDDPGGTPSRPGGPATRCDLGKFGLEGRACARCYHRVLYRHQRGLPLPGPVPERASC